jgi:SAM-dependent methyltransferase
MLTDFVGTSSSGWQVFGFLPPALLFQSSILSAAQPFRYDSAMSSFLRLLLVLLVAALPGRSAELSTANRYEFRPASRDGIGKFYLGREIARVMGHQGADWLERPERDQEERASLVLPALKLKPGDVVADLGCGTGYFTWRLAQAVGPNGVVHAVDIQPEMLERLTARMQQRGLTNVLPVLGTVTDPKLPARALDLVLMVDVYHEFDHPFEMMERVCAALKPGGRVVFVEYRGEDPTVPIKPLHKMTEAQIRREMAVHPLEWVETIGTLPRQHLILFRRKP